MKSSHHSGHDRSRDGRTVQAAQDILSGKQKGNPLSRLLPFLGPAFIASVAYVDPGNFATNIQSGAKFGYMLLWVIVASNLMAMLLQTLSAKLGIATGNNLAEHCRMHFPKPIVYGMWIIMELVAMATDLAEFLGAALGFNLLLGVPLWLGGLLTAGATFLILALERYGFRPIETVITVMIGVIASCYLVETFLDRPDWANVAVHAILPQFSGSESVVLAAGILGATVMPHALFLHSALTQGRIRVRGAAKLKKLTRYEIVDVAIAMGIASLIKLVPLDGSRMAESVLPAAAGLADCLGASAVLFHILESSPPRLVHGEPHLQSADQARRYLAGIARRFFPAEVQVRTHVHLESTNDVAGSVARHSEEIDFDLVVMCVHGRRGLRHLRQGFLAQQLVSRGPASVLVFRAEQLPDDPSFCPTSLLLPLDGQPGHDRAVEVTRELALALQAHVVLLIVVPTFSTLTGRSSAASRMLPGTTYHALNMAKEAAAEYLLGVHRRLESAGLPVTSTVLRGHPARTILRASRSFGSNLLVLGTHGRAGAEAFWFDSVASRVCNRTHLPCLLVPVADKKSRD